MHSDFGILLCALAEDGAFPDRRNPFRAVPQRQAPQVLYRPDEGRGPGTSVSAPQVIRDAATSSLRRPKPKAGLALFNRAAREVIERYRDQQIGVTDASLVVLADRHRTRSILSLVRRHFDVLRPLDGGRFRLLPDPRGRGLSRA